MGLWRTMGMFEWRKMRKNWGRGLRRVWRFGMVDSLVWMERQT